MSEAIVVEVAIEQFLVLDEKATDKKTIRLLESVFAVAYNMPLIHQVIIAYMAAGRAGTKQNKSRSDVRGGGKKPWRQKGTGRARAGTNNSPLWRGGGVTFAAEPRDYSQKINRKMYRVAMKSILSQHVRLGSMKVVDTMVCKSPKTKDLIACLQGIDASGRVYMVQGDMDENLTLASRNIPKVQVTNVEGLDPVSLFRADMVVLSRHALEKIEEWLA